MARIKTRKDKAMNDEKGWICLFRKFLEWEWYDDANVMRVFIHLLLCANHQDNKWRGKLIRRGELITSQSKLAYSLKLSIMQIRNSLSKLKRTGEITVLTTPEYSVISIKNYDLYQINNRPKNAQRTYKELTSNRRATTNNNDNKREIINNLSLYKITKKEREILKNYFFELNQKRKIKIDDIDAYIRTLIENGDYLTKLEKAKKKLEQQKSKENIPTAAEKIQKATPEEDKAGLELLRDAVKKIRKGTHYDTNIEKGKTRQKFK